MNPFGGGFGLQRGHFSVKMYAKTKELGPVGGACAGTPPRSAYGIPNWDQFHPCSSVLTLSHFWPSSFRSNNLVPGFVFGLSKSNFVTEKKIRR